MKNVTVAIAFCLSLAGLIQPAIAIDLTPEEATQLRTAQQAQAAGDHARALTLLQQLATKHPQEADLPRLMSHSYFELGRYPEARKAAITAISLGRVSSDVLVRLVQIDRERGDDLATLNSVRLLTITDPENVSWRILYGELLLAMERHAEAGAVFQELIDAKPASAELWLRLANTQLQRDMIDQATISFETAWRLGDRSKSLPAILSGLHQRRGDVEAALRWLDHTIELEAAPDPSLLLRKATLLHSLDDFEHAGEIASKLAEQNNKEVAGKASLLLGQMALQKQNTEAAIEHWKAAHDADVQHASLSVSLARLYVNQRKHKEAVPFLISHLASNPEDAKSQLLLARCQLQIADGAAARLSLQRYLERFGTNSEADELITLLARTAPSP